jgi:hypothetical protein
VRDKAPAGQVLCPFVLRGELGLGFLQLLDDRREPRFDLVGDPVDPSLGIGDPLLVV